MLAKIINDDREFGGNKPFIDLTPEDLWGGTIKAKIGAEGLSMLEGCVAARAGHVCELCGAGKGIQGFMGKGATKFKVEPRFAYDDRTQVATLKRLMHICNQCGQSIHLRQTQIQSQGMPSFRSPMIGAIARLVKFHNVTEAGVLCELDSHLRMWRNRVVRDVDLLVAIDAVRALKTVGHNADH